MDCVRNCDTDYAGRHRSQTSKNTEVEPTIEKIGELERGIAQNKTNYNDILTLLELTEVNVVSRLFPCFLKVIPHYMKPDYFIFHSIMRNSIKRQKLYTHRSTLCIAYLLRYYQKENCYGQKKYQKMIPTKQLQHYG